MSSQEIQQLETWHANGQLDQAKQWLATQLDIHDDDADLHYWMGNICRSQSDWKHALEHYAIASQLDPQGPGTTAHQLTQQILAYRCRDLYNP